MPQRVAPSAPASHHRQGYSHNAASSNNPECVPSCARRVAVAPPRAPGNVATTLRPHSPRSRPSHAEDPSFVSSSRAATVDTDDIDRFSWPLPPSTSLVSSASLPSPPPAPKADPTQSFSSTLTAAAWKSGPGKPQAVVAEPPTAVTSSAGESRFDDAETNESAGPDMAMAVHSPTSASSSQEDIFMPPLFPDQLQHQPCYCEENAYWIAEHLVGRLREEMDRCEVKVVFISNHNRTVTMWQQRASSRSSGHIVWDYHVVVLLRRLSHSGRPTGAWIYDADSRMSGKSLHPKHLRPVPLAAYLDGSFRFAVDVGAGGPVTHEAHTSPSRRPLFRLVEAQAYIDGFASDRTHMLFDGCWLAPPPPWAPIEGRLASLRRQSNNLEDLVDMNRSGWGRILELAEMDRVATEERGSDRTWVAGLDAAGRGGGLSGDTASLASPDGRARFASPATATTDFTTAAHRAEALEAALGSPLQSPSASAQTIEVSSPSQHFTPALLAPPVRPSPRKRPAPLPPSEEATNDTTNRFRDVSSASEPITTTTTTGGVTSFLDDDDDEDEDEEEERPSSALSPDHTPSSEERDEVGELPSEYVPPQLRERRAVASSKMSGQSILAHRLAPSSRAPPPPPTDAIPVVLSAASSSSNDTPPPIPPPLHSRGASSLRPSAPSNVPVSPSSYGTPSPNAQTPGAPLTRGPGYLLTPPGSSHGSPPPASPSTPRRGGRVSSPLFPAYLASTLASRATRARGSYMGLSDGSFGPAAGGNGASISQADLERLKQLA